MEMKYNMCMMMFTFITLCLQQFGDSATLVVDGVSEWNNPTVQVGDSIIFRHKYNYNLYIFKNRRAFNLCNFTESTLLTPQSPTFTVVMDIHGKDCFDSMSAKSSGTWNNIISAMKHTHELYSFPIDVIIRKVGNGMNTRFWKDLWCGDQILASRFSRLFAIELARDCTVFDRRSNLNWNWNWRREIRNGHEQVQFDNMINMLPNEYSGSEDSWVWNLDGKSHFSVANIRKFIDHKISSNGVQSRWNKYVPKKINLFAWRLLRNGLPTHVNLFGRGVDITTVRCNLCDNGFDDVSHIFHQCSFMHDIRGKICNWLHYDIPDAKPIDMVSWYKGLQLTHHKRRVLEAIVFIWWWHIWKDRNNVLHNGTHACSNDTFNSIVSLSFLWITNRDRKHSYVWGEWLVNPFENG